MHSILIIGCGSIGERHLRCFLQTGRAVVTACDTNPILLHTMIKKYAVPASDSWEQAVAKGAFDAVVICAPAHLHVPIATHVLERKLHVLIEKPLSQSLDGIDNLLRLRDTSGCEAAVAYVLHVYPYLKQAREFLAKEELGPILHVTATYGQPFHRLRPAYAQTYYRDHQTGGGAIQDALTHVANWVEGVVGPTESVLCDCAHQLLDGVAVEDTVNVSARNGRVLVNYALNQFQCANETTIQFHAPKGSVKIEFHHQRWGIFKKDALDWEWHEAPVADRDSHFVAQANCFLDQIEGKPAPLCTLEAAHQTLRFNLACLAAAASGSRVTCQAPTA